MNATSTAGVAEGITERRHLEVLLRQTQKMESIGMLAGAQDPRRSSPRSGINCRLVGIPHPGAKMPTYLWKGSYTSDGVKGLAKEGGSKRRTAVQQMVEKAGGKVHTFYFAMGESDVYVIAEFPDAATAVAVSLAVNASGAVRLSTTPLLSPEEFDAAATKGVAYRAPGA